MSKQQATSNTPSISQEHHYTIFHLFDLFSEELPPRTNPPVTSALHGVGLLFPAHVAPAISVPFQRSFGRSLGIGVIQIPPKEGSFWTVSEGFFQTVRCWRLGT